MPDIRSLVQAGSGDMDLRSLKMTSWKSVPKVPAMCA
jgi:hypothetical protein